MKVINIVGARPQFIKAAMVSRSLKSKCNEMILHTGQHYDDNMSKIFFEELKIPHANIELNIGGGSHAEQTGKMLIEIEKVLLIEKPDWVIVYGDTNSTLAGALGAVKLNIPLAHVEAGVRSFNRDMPEEINRIVCDHISNQLFCPTKNAVEILRSEGVTKNVDLVGDVMIDALHIFAKIAARHSSILRNLRIEKRRYGLATIHRVANTDNPSRLISILTALGKLEFPIIFPIHPRTQKVILQEKIRLEKNIIPTEPLGYLDTIQLEANADCILTDSGGIQKEAYWFGVRCLTLRDETEWMETVHAGWNKLVGARTEDIINAAKNWYPDTARESIFGDGNAAGKIGEILTNVR